jgi:hypothetical protein
MRTTGNRLVWEEGEREESKVGIDLLGALSKERRRRVLLLVDKL